MSRDNPCDELVSLTTAESKFSNTFNISPANYNELGHLFFHKAMQFIIVLKQISYGDN